MTDLHPLLSLKRNPTTNEVFLRLKKHKNIILTPSRRDDASSLIKYFNDIRVYRWLANTPFPFLPEHAENMLGRTKQNFDDALREFEEVGHRIETPQIIGSAPVGSIREVQEDGSDVVIGTIKIGRSNFGEHLNTNTVDWENKHKNEVENESKAIGDPTIYWMIGCFLAPSHHGQGIMTDVIDTFLQDWAVPYMGVRHIMVGAFEENIGSIKVFEKNGFRKLRVIENYRVIRGEMRNLQILEKYF